jgi:hypothetical protein
MSEFNIIGPKFDPTVDLKLFFTDKEIETGERDFPLIPLHENDKSMAHLLARLGKFSSTSEAKKNGWMIPIPLGWSHFVIGKGKKRDDFFIWNPEQTLEEFALTYMAKKFGVTEEEFEKRLVDGIFNAVSGISS